MARGDADSSDKLCLSLAYDVNGFVWGSVEQWWGDVLTLVNDVLVR